MSKHDVHRCNFANHKGKRQPNLVKSANSLKVLFSSTKSSMHDSIKVAI